MLLSVVCLLLAFRKVNLTELGAGLTSAALPIVGAAAAVLTGSLLVRALRWQLLLLSVRRLALLDLFSYVMIGYLTNALLPFRLGDIARAVYIGERCRESKSTILATIVVERVLDILSVVLLFLVVGFFMDVSLEVKRVVWPIAGAAVLGAVVLWALSLPGVWSWRGIVAGKVALLVPNGIRRKGACIATSFVAGLQALHSIDRLVGVLAYSLVVWGLIALSTGLFFKAFDLSLPWYAPLLTVVVLNLGAMLPSSPGAIGVAHLLIILSLSPWRVEPSVALSVAIVIHGVNLALNILLGLLALWRESITFASLRRVERFRLVSSGPRRFEEP